MGGVQFSPFEHDGSRWLGRLESWNPADPTWLGGGWQNSSSPTGLSPRSPLWAQELGRQQLNLSSLLTSRQLWAGASSPHSRFCLQSEGHP